MSQPLPDVSFTIWALTVAGILAVFGFDLFVSGRGEKSITFRASVLWTLVYTAAGVLFGVGLGLLADWDSGTQYLAGYLVERSLSVDNLFVFVIIMATFTVPMELQPWVLTAGILAALALRAVFIALGAALITTFSFMFLLFGLLLIATAIQLYRHRDEDPSIEDNKIVQLAQRRLPFTESYAGRHLRTTVDGRRLFTPLALVLIAIGTSDVLFALDSIPAIFGVTQDAYIVFVANAFALLGLRALYFLVAELLDRLVYLSIGLALILAFIGIKLVLEFVHELDDRTPEISTGMSLAAIGLILAVTTVASLIKSSRDPAARAHAGSLRGHPSKPGDGET